MVTTGRRIYLETHFGMPVSLEDASAARQLLGHVRDPMRRAAFRNIFGHSLAASGYFDEALSVIEEQLADAGRARLEFVVPYCYASRAIVHTGRREYVLAEEALDEAEHRAQRAGDQTAYHIAWAVRNRRYVSQGAVDLALSRELSSHPVVTRCLHAELMASYSLALAGTSQTEQARALAQEADSQSIGPETVISAHCTLAVIALRGGFPEEGLDHARTALGQATHSRMVEAFVAAYRGFPELVVSLLGDREAHDALSRVLARVGDASITASSDPVAKDRSVNALSRREKEVSH